MSNLIFDKSKLFMKRTITKGYLYLSNQQLKNRFQIVSNLSCFREKPQINHEEINCNY